MLARTHLPLCGSTASPASSTASAPAASLVRTTVPALPGSATPTSTVTSRGSPARASSRPTVTVEHTAATPWGVTVSERAAAAFSVTRATRTPAAVGPAGEVRVAVGHGVGEEEVVHLRLEGRGLLGPGQRVPHGAQALDEETPGLETRRAPQQLAGCDDARRAFGEELAQAASSFFAFLSPAFLSWGPPPGRPRPAR